jgi:hypothetical protein
MPSQLWDRDVYLLLCRLTNSAEYKGEYGTDHELKLFVIIACKVVGVCTTYTQHMTGTIESKIDLNRPKRHRNWPESREKCHPLVLYWYVFKGTISLTVSVVTNVSGEGSLDSTNPEIDADKLRDALMKRKDRLYTTYISIHTNPCNAYRAMLREICMERFRDSHDLMRIGTGSFGWPRPGVGQAIADGTELVWDEPPWVATRVLPMRKHALHLDGKIP